MNAALIFEDARGNTHHFQVVLLEAVPGAGIHTPLNITATVCHLRESKALKRPVQLRMQVVEADVLETIKVPT